MVGVKHMCSLFSVATRCRMHLGHCQDIFDDEDGSAELQGTLVLIPEVSPGLTIGDGLARKRARKMVLTF